MGAGKASAVEGDREDPTLPPAQGKTGHRQTPLLLIIHRTQPRQVRKGRGVYTVIKNSSPGMTKIVDPGRFFYDTVHFWWL